MKKSVCAIILSAGRSSRMGQFKGGLRFKNHTILESVVNCLHVKEVDKIIVVTGRYRDEVESLLSGYSELQLAFNDTYASGLMSSIKTGISRCKEQTDYLICLGDMPFVQSDTIQKIIGRANEKKVDEKYIIRPIMDKKSGHPVMFSHHFRNELLRNNNPEGANNVVKENRSALIEIEVPDEGVLVDIDTKEEYTHFQNNNWQI